LFEVLDAVVTPKSAVVFEVAEEVLQSTEMEFTQSAYHASDPQGMETLTRLLGEADEFETPDPDAEVRARLLSYGDDGTPEGRSKAQAEADHQEYVAKRNSTDDAPEDDAQKTPEEKMRARIENRGGGDLFEEDE
jgi:hypothetical protein